MKNKKKLIILSIVAILLIVVLTQASYAYFTTPGSTGSEETISSGTMALSFSDGPQINATNLAPGDYIEKTFSVTNTGTLATTYDVYLSEVVNTFVQRNDLVYELTSNDGGYNTSSEVVVPNQEAKIVDTQSIAVGATHTYTLKITYKLTNQIQNDNMGRGFTAKININEYNLNNTEKLLKLLDTSGNLVDKQMISSGVTDYYYNLANTSLTGTTNIYCNNGGIPTISNNQLIVTGLTVDTECKMSSDVVDTINNRLTTTKTGIVMTNNQNNISRMNVISGKEIVFDLNGKILNSSNVNSTDTTWVENTVGFRIIGTLTVNDSVGTGEINTSAGEPVFAMSQNGTLYVNGGNFNGRSSIFNSAKNVYMELNGGTFGAKTEANIVFKGNDTTMIVNNANITQSHYGSAGFSEGCSNCYLEVNDGHYSINEQAWLFATMGTNSGTITINGGTYISNVVGILGVRSGTVNINGGTFETPNSYSLHMVAEYAGTLNVNDGIFYSRDTIINQHSKLGQVNITGGTYESTASRILYTDSGNITVNQTSKPIYMKSSSQTWYPVAVNDAEYDSTNDTGKIIINGTIANKCTSNSSDTTSGLCMYAEGDKVYNTNKANAAVQITKSGKITINGGTYYGGHQGFNVHSNGALNIKNAKIYSGHCAIDNNDTGEVNICNTEINAFSNTYQPAPHNIYNKTTGIVNNYNVTYTNPSAAIYDPNNGISTVSSCSF